MRKFVLILAVIAAIGTGAAVAALTAAGQLPAAPTADQLLAAPTTTQLVGQLVDSACYATLGTEATGPAHAKCNLACAQKGHRLALVTPKGEVYRVAGSLTERDNAKLIPLVNRTVVLTGTVSQLIRTIDTATGDVRLTTVTADLQLADATSTVTVAVPTDARRQSGTIGGLVAKVRIRKDDFREGDVREGIMMIIDAASAALATK